MVRKFIVKNMGENESKKNLCLSANLKIISFKLELMIDLLRLLRIQKETYSKLLKDSKDSANAPFVIINALYSFCKEEMGPAHCSCKH